MRPAFSTTARTRAGFFALGFALILAGCAGAASTGAKPVAVSFSGKLAFSGKRIGKLVAINSQSPFIFTQILQGADMPKTRISGSLSIPDGKGRKPAMLLVHGSGGPGERSVNYARILNGMGVVTLRTDSFTPRGVTSTVGKQASVTEAMMTADAFNALAYLAKHPEVDPDRIGIMGWSKGGGVTILAMWDDVRRALVGENTRFAAHLAFYPPCFVDVGDLDMTGAPLLILIGEEDEWTPAEPCDELTEVLKDNGTPTELIVYPGAHHSFDNPASGERLHKDAYIYEGCYFRMAPEGFLEDDLGEPIRSAEDMQRAIEECSPGKGVRTAPNPEAARKAVVDMRRFLRSELISK